MESEMEREVILWQSSLLYYGRVVDENDAPIFGAQAAYSANSMDASLVEFENKGTATTDARGIFKIEGVRGVGLMVQVTHPGYYAYPTNSTGFDKRSLPQKGYFSDSEENAEVFRMHRKGHPVPLIHRRAGTDAPMNGTPIRVDLFSETRQRSIAELSIQAWTKAPSEVPGKLCDWKVRLGVPGGGIVESTNQFESVAPGDGYREFADIEVSGAESVRKNYFLSTSNGFLLLKTYFISGKALFASLEYFLNPDHSRNLELDLAQVIHPTQ